MKKYSFYSELFYILGILTLAFGCAFMEQADFGLSMVVAPAYLFYRKLSLTWSFITFGVMEYLFQAFLLILMILVVRRFKFSYLFSFVTAVLYGYTLNGTMFITNWIPCDTMTMRLFLFIAGMILCSIGVACMLHTYISAEVYELIIKEIPKKFNLNLTKFKTIYDCISCFISVLLSFFFFGFGHFEGVKFGTLVCALINGFLIGRFSSFFDRHLKIKDALPLRKFFEK